MSGPELDLSMPYSWRDDPRGKPVAGDPLLPSWGEGAHPNPVSRDELEAIDLLRLAAALEALAVQDGLQRDASESLEVAAEIVRRTAMACACITRGSR